jgi:HEAT repeat protein
MSFSDVMAQFRDGVSALSSPMLYALTAPSSSDTRQFRQEWSSLPVEQRRRIITALAEQAEANFELDFDALFRVAMDDADGQVRTVAIDGLWEDEEPSLIASLVRTLQKDQTPSVRAAAASSLGRFVLLLDLEELDESYASSIHSVLAEKIHDPAEELEVRRRAVESIAYWDDPSVAAIIADAYKSDEELMRISAVFAMGRSADPVWADTVNGELGNPNPAMRYEAARSAGELEVKRAVPALIKLVSDRDREVQLAAIAALGQIGGQRAKQVLERCASGSDEAVNLAAEDALAELALSRQSLDLLVFGHGADDREERLGALEDDDDEMDEDD